MTQPEYDQQKRECWEQYKRESLDSEVQWQPVSRYDVFCAAFDRAYALGKQENDMEDHVIQGWVCRDKKDNALYLHAEKPYRAQSGCDVCDDPDWWENDYALFLPLDKSLFPNLTWESDPQEVEIIIKRKKKNL